MRGALTGPYLSTDNLLAKAVGNRAEGGRQGDKWVTNNLGKWWINGTRWGQWRLSTISRPNKTNKNRCLAK